MLISSEQIANIVAGSLLYVSCDWCGKHSSLIQAGSLAVCPHCRNHCDEAGMSYFGFESEGCKKYGLSYEFNAGDFQSGD
jgi:hypothetical protein